MVETLYHFTCDDHGYPGIVRTGRIVGQPHPLMPHLGPLIWLSSEAQVDDPYDLGLTSSLLTCDRTARCFRVTCKAAIPWEQLRARVSSTVLSDLESCGKPDTWWVVRRPVTGREFAEAVATGG